MILDTHIAMISNVSVITFEYKESTMKVFIIFVILALMIAFEIYMFKSTKGTQRYGWVSNVIGSIFLTVAIILWIIVSL